MEAQAMRRRRFERPSFAHALVIFLLVRPSPLRPGEESLDLAKVKELEAKEKLQRLEETMDRLATLLAESEPQNAAKLRRAFQESRQRLVLQRMDRVIQYLQEKKIDRALEEHRAVRLNLEELIAILQEEDVDPREILKHIQRLRDIVKGLDQSLVEQAAEKAATEEAASAGAGEGLGAKELETLEDLIRRQKENKKAIKQAIQQAGKPVVFRDLPDEEGEIATFLTFFLPAKEAAEAVKAKMAESGVSAAVLDYWHFAANIASCGGDFPATQDLLQRSVTLEIQVLMEPVTVQRTAEVAAAAVKAVA